MIPCEALLPARSLTCRGFGWGPGSPGTVLLSEAMPGWRMHTGATWDGLHFFSNSSLLPIGSIFFQARAEAVLYLIILVWPVKTWGGGCAMLFRQPSPAI